MWLDFEITATLYRKYLYILEKIRTSINFMWVWIWKSFLSESFIFIKPLIFSCSRGLKVGERKGSMYFFETISWAVISSKTTFLLFYLSVSNLLSNISDNKNTHLWVQDGATLWTDDDFFIYRCLLQTVSLCVEAIPYIWFKTNSSD